MSDKPNNFPREGQHSIVTRAALDRLARERPTLNAELHYTIGGSTEAVVHSNLAAEREGAMTRGERRLQSSSHAVNAEFRQPSGDARAAYVSNQKALATQWRARQHQRGPTR